MVVKPGSPKAASASLFSKSICRSPLLPHGPNSRSAESPPGTLPQRKTRIRDFNTAYYIHQSRFREFDGRMNLATAVGVGHAKVVGVLEVPE